MATSNNECVFQMYDKVQIELLVTNNTKNSQEYN